MVPLWCHLANSDWAGLVPAGEQSAAFPGQGVSGFLACRTRDKTRRDQSGQASDQGAARDARLRLAYQLAVGKAGRRSVPKCEQDSHRHAVNARRHRPAVKRGTKRCAKRGIAERLAPLFPKTIPKTIQGEGVAGLAQKRHGGASWWKDRAAGRAFHDNDRRRGRDARSFYTSGVSNSSEARSLPRRRCLREVLR
jgi:hypothetical protein